MSATARKAMDQASELIESAIRQTGPDRPRALVKMHMSLDYARAAFILLNEGEGASVGHADDPIAQEP